jgi:hypothetical protein
VTLAGDIIRGKALDLLVEYADIADESPTEESTDPVGEPVPETPSEEST